MKKLHNLKIKSFPEGITINLGSDNRGQCYYFDHIEFGRLGKLIIINSEDNKQELNYDFFDNSKNYHMRLGIFKRLIHIINEANNNEI